jgi:hypothetical protein
MANGKFVRKFRRMLFKRVTTMRVETKLKSARVIIPGPGNRQAGIKRMVHCHSTQSACHRPSFLDFLHFCGTCRIHSPSIHCFRLLRPCPTHKADGLAPPRRTPKNTRSRRHGDGRPLPASTVADCVSTLPLLLPSPRAALSLSLLATIGGPLPPLNAR